MPVRSIPAPTVRLSLVNRSLLQQAGLTSPPRLWSEVAQFARRIRERTGRYGLFLTVVPDDSAEMLEALVQMGVKLLDDQRRAAFDTSVGRDAFRFWTELYREGLLPREVVSQGQRRAIELFQSGELAMAATGAEFLRSIQTNAPGIAAVTEPHPPLTGADGVANGLVTWRSCSRASSARWPWPWLLISCAANQERFATEARVLPSSVEASVRFNWLLSGSNHASSTSTDPRCSLVVCNCLARARVLVPAMPGIKRLQKILYTQLQRSMLNQISSDQAITTAAEQWNSYAEARWP